MSHHHHHGHCHADEPAEFNKAFAIAVIANLSFSLIEAAFAIYGNSMSLLADAGHNLGDVLGLLLAWIAAILLSKNATAKYSYGFKRTSILAALINALVLVATSALIAYESIYKLMNPVPVDEAIVIAVATIGIVINGVTATLFFRGRKADLNIKAAFLHLAFDALISLGVVLVGITMYHTQWIWLDPVVGLIIVVIILAGTWGLLKDSVDLIMDAVPSWVDMKGVTTYLEELPGVDKVHDLHVWGLSTQGAALTAHLIMSKEVLTDKQLHDLAEYMEHHFKIVHVTIQVEKGSDTYPCHQTC